MTNSFKPDDDNDKSHVETKQPTDLFELPNITTEFVKNEIRNLSTNKATGNDELSVRLLKLVSDIPLVIDSFAYIYIYRVAQKERNGILPVMTL